MKELIESDVLILGSGIAGATAALTLADSGKKVTMVTRASEAKESNSYYAQGGIIYEGEKGSDSPKMLEEDILRAGDGRGNPEAARILSEDGPRMVEEILLKRVQVPFDTNDNGLSRTKEGGHQVARIIHQADTTGRAIEETLISEIAKHPRIELLVGVTAVDLLTPAHHSSNRKEIYSPLSCVGAYLLDQKSGRVSRAIAQNTILATGGLGQVFEFTTNPQGARGDGIAIAHRAGARVLNLEYIQFHPTAFFNPSAPRFLLTEAIRGEGGRLTDQNGKPFMEKYDPERKDLATRDLVARAIYSEMLKESNPSMFLDLKSYIPREKILEHFPNIHETLLKYGVDITTDLVPVVPAAHYSCGGVWSSVENGETTIENLYAVGEVACNGLHGANRLASTSLLEGLVWGKRAAEDIKNRKGTLPKIDSSSIRSWQDYGNPIADPAVVDLYLRTVKGLMWNLVGLVRTKERLDLAREEVGHMSRSSERLYQKSKVSDSVLGLRNISTVANLITESAWENKTSAGSHYRES